MQIEIITPSKTAHDLFEALRASPLNGANLVVAKSGEVYFYAKIIRKNAVVRGFRGSTIPVEFGFGLKFSPLTHWENLDQKHGGHCVGASIAECLENVKADAYRTYAKYPAA
jgi:hypothetical protein